ncbi:MAG: hypothetical protein RJB65_390 [Actinomycetota bacterium]
MPESPWASQPLTPFTVLMNNTPVTLDLHGLLASVRARGAAATLSALEAERPAFHVLADGTAVYHHTEAAFMVWAIDRLVEAGLSDLGVLWHPLVQVASARAWWTDETLATEAAIRGFVPSDKALAHEPQPLALLAA